MFERLLLRIRHERILDKLLTDRYLSEERRKELMRQNALLFKKILIK